MNITTIAPITALFFLLAPSIVGAGEPSRKPNIVHIHADDFRADGLRALGNSVVETPNLDALVERGASFRCCYTMGSMVGAVCLPSRTMMLTGRSWLRIPKANGGDPSVSLPAVLRTAGYDTFHVGKGGNEYSVGLKAFDTNIVMDDRTVLKRRLSSASHADAVIRFLKERQSSKPFYIYFAPPVPHDPRVAEAEFHKRYDASKIPLPAAFMPLHPFDNGDMTVRDEKLAPWPRTPDDTRQQLADYYACISCLDHHVGRVFAAIKAHGQWEDSVIVFTGDNGLSLGEHGLFGKQNLYEFGGMHVPCVIAGRGIQAGQRSALVYLMDLFPTFVDFASAKLPQGVEGKSLRPILEGKESAVREVLYTGYRDCQRAIRDGRWKLIRYPLVDRTQLFDLNNDPRELNDLSNDAKHSERLKAITASLEREMNRYGDQVPLRVAHPRPAEWKPPKGDR
jgi:arylsulfatase A-like enzyme